MTDRQSIALSNPIDPADLEALEKCARTLTRGIQKFGTILTVDRHWRGLSWHVSVALLDETGLPSPINVLSGSERTLVLGLATELLADAGRPNSEEVHEDVKSVHVTRHLTIEEERQARKGLATAAARKLDLPQF